MPNYMDIDKGSETDAPATMHCFLHRQHPDVETDEGAVKTYISSINFKPGSFAKCGWYVSMVLSKMKGAFIKNNVISDLFCLLFQWQL